MKNENGKMKNNAILVDNSFCLRYYEVIDEKNIFFYLHCIDFFLFWPGSFFFIRRVTST